MITNVSLKNFKFDTIIVTKNNCSIKNFMNKINE